MGGNCYNCSICCIMVAFVDVPEVDVLRHVSILIIVAFAITFSSECFFPVTMTFAPYLCQHLNTETRYNILTKLCYVGC